MKKFLIAVSVGFFCLILVGLSFQNTEAALSNSVIRFHVLANSDSKEDQELKLKVRNRIIDEMNTMFGPDEDINSARSTIINNIDKIETIAKDEIKKNGYSYDVKVKLGKSDFPTKEYGDIVLPAGEYEALKVEIGNAQGKNWWCVLFPPLCFVDESAVTVDADVTDIVLNRVGNDNKEFIKKDKSSGVKFKFKTYEMWQMGKRKIAYLFGMK